MNKLLLIAAFILLGASFIYAQEDLKTYTKVGKQMPDFSVKDLSDSEFKLSNFRGKVVFVYFWATWCPYCRAEMQHLEQEIWQKYKSEDFAMIAVAREETNQQITRYKEQANISFPFAADSSGEIFNQFANRGVPRSYVVDRNGKILFQSIGLEEENYDVRKNIIEKELNKIKKEKTGK